MAGLGKILQKIDPSLVGYERDNIKYEKLSQDPHDNEAEDDDVVFARDGVISNGNIEDGHASVNGIHLHKAKILKGGSDVEVKVKKRRILTRYRGLCFLCILLIVVAVAFSTALMWPVLSGKNITVMHYKSTPDWTVLIEDTASESCLRLYDVDSDGRDDIILGTVRTEMQMAAMDLTRASMAEFCRSKGTTVPCVGNIKAFRGYDGAELWSIPVYGTVFEINCGKIDVNKDGHMDCLAAGRIGTSVAFDPRNGNVHWAEDLDALGEGWNTYQALVLPDFTGDGVPEVLLPDGGDPKFEPEEHVRYAGRLILLDGATGRKIGRDLRTTDEQGEKETYMSPVLHETKDGSMYILYGSGGETVYGSFYAISVPDLYRYVMSLDKKAHVPNAGKGKYNDFLHVDRDRDGICTIYTSASVGVMVPPVCIDINGDSVKDILMSAYDGTLILYDGQTLETMWTQKFPGYEMYSTPAPGYMNDDNIPDFMFHINRGTWDGGYNYSLLIVLDGSNGAKLMTVNTTYVEMASDLVAMTTQEHRDIFVARIQRRVPQDASARRKRQLFDPRYQRQHSQADRYTNDRLNQFGYQGQQDNDPYAYHPYSYNTHKRYEPSDDFRQSFANIPTKNVKDENVGGRAYSGRGSYSQDDSGDADGTGSQQWYDDGAPNGYYDSDKVSNMNSMDSGIQDEGDHTFEKPKNRVFHPDPQATVIVDGNDKCKTAELLEKTTEFYAIDRSTMLKPLLLYADRPQKFYYNLTVQDREDIKNSYTEVEDLNRPRRYDGPGEGHDGPGEGHDGPGEGHDGPGEGPGEQQQYDMQYDMQVVLSDDDEMCSVTRTTERSTGAIGDLDGDGNLDLVLILHQSGEKHDKFGSDFKPVSNVRLMKIDLHDALRAAEAVDLHANVAPGAQTKETLDIRDVKFRPKEEQLWTAYLGAQGDSIYHVSS